MKLNLNKTACAGLLLAACATQGAWAANCATTAAPRAVEYPWMSVERWRQMHADQVARAKQGDVDVMFLGDSLTEMWPKPMWDHHFGHFKAANFGIGGDHTGNVLWRLKDPALAGLKPKLVVLMIGVNNINLCNESADEVFGGIQAVVGTLRKQYPQAHILLNAVLPERAPDSDERRRIVSLNQKVKTLDDGKAVFVRDYGAHFMGPGGELSKELQPDLLHFSEKGYAVLADAIRPDIERLLASARANPEARGVGRPAIALAQDDVAAFAPPPKGFDVERGGIARGTMGEFSYDSAATGTRRQAMVYLPPGYSPQRRYPVLYLLHGIGGNQHEWRGYVRANTVLDNLMADGKAAPMIVVMPNGRAQPDDAVPPGERTFTPEHIAAFGRFERDLLDSLIPAIDRAYPTQAEPGRRALAGLSMGGGQSLNFGLAHPEAFAWVGGFSSAPNTRHGAELLSDPAAAKRSLRLLYLSCGKQDGLIGVSQGAHRYLQQQGVKHTWHVDAYGHDRDSWAENLYHFAQLLFR